MEWFEEISRKAELKAKLKQWNGIGRKERNSEMCQFV